MNCISLRKVGLDVMQSWLLYRAECFSVSARPCRWLGDEGALLSHGGLISGEVEAPSVLSLSVCSCPLRIVSVFRTGTWSCGTVNLVGEETCSCAGSVSHLWWPCLGQTGFWQSLCAPGLNDLRCGWSSILEELIESGCDGIMSNFLFFADSSNDLWLCCHCSLATCTHVQVSPSTQTILEGERWSGWID